MAPTYQIAIIQMDMEDNNVETNFETASSYIKSAASRGAHLAILPEYHLTSWAPSSPEFLPATRASMTCLARYQTLARDLNISIVPGTICEVHPVAPSAPDRESDADEEIRNMCYFIAAGTGDILGSYQKKNLWHPERRVLTSGGGHSPHVAFDTPLRKQDGSPVRAGLLICWDLAFPEAFRQLIAPPSSADLIIIPSWWRDDDAGAELLALNKDAEKIFLESTTIARAYENTAAIAFCNYGGMSGLRMPGLGAVSNMAVGETGMVISEMDLDVLRVAEENYKVRADLAKEDWHYNVQMRSPASG